MNEILEKEKIVIENIIFEIRGKQVMLDSDLAKLYGVETKRINEAVKNNIDKFPERFSWKLVEEEYINLKSKISTSSLYDGYGGKRKLPRVFTEQGVAMLATILKSKTAVNVSIAIMDAFVAMRKYVSTSLIDQKFVNDMVLKHEYDIKLLQQSFDKLQEKEQNNSIFFEGQIYDAYSLLIDIFKKSKVDIIVIDNYVDKNLLDVFSKIDKKVIVITNKYNNTDYIKYQKQYSNVTLRINNDFHDRFIIIDRKILYHCGASFKDLGNKCFAINRIDNKEILDKLLTNINKEVKNGW